MLYNTATKTVAMVGHGANHWSYYWPTVFGLFHSTYPLTWLSCSDQFLRTSTILSYMYYLPLISSRASQLLYRAHAIVSCCTLQLLDRACATFHQHEYQTVHFNYFIEHVLLPINISIMSYTSATSSSQPTYVSYFIEHVLPLTNTSTRLHNSVASLENVLRTSYQVT